LLKEESASNADAGASVRHRHGSSWPASVDWIDLRNHLVNVHGQSPDAIDDFASYVDGTTGRRRFAEERHEALHLAAANSNSVSAQAEQMTDRNAEDEELRSQSE
jgi:hypothetical protein